jgi:hypothetical protein
MSVIGNQPGRECAIDHRSNCLMVCRGCLDRMRRINEFRNKENVLVRTQALLVNSGCLLNRTVLSTGSLKAAGNRG